jgi:hypothetical protein
VETASMVTDNDISMSQSQEAMEIQTQRTTNTAISSIGNTTIGNTDSTTGSEVYTKAGGKGEFHHRQKNPRKAVVKEDKEEEKERQMEIFAHKIFNGNVSMVKKIKEAFDQCDKINPTAATAMLTNFCVQGCKEGLLRTVFGIGYSRYVKSRDGPRELDENSGRYIMYRLLKLGHVYVSVIRTLRITTVTNYYYYILNPNSIQYSFLRVGMPIRDACVFYHPPGCFHHPRGIFTTPGGFSPPPGEFHLPPGGKKKRSFFSFLKVQKHPFFTTPRGFSPPGGAKQRHIYIYMYLNINYYFYLYSKI